METLQLDPPILPHIPVHNHRPFYTAAMHGVVVRQQDGEWHYLRPIEEEITLSCKLPPGTSTTKDQAYYLLRVTLQYSYGRWERLVKRTVLAPGKCQWRYYTLLVVRASPKLVNHIDLTLSLSHKWEPLPTMSTYWPLHMSRNLIRFLPA